ncbi:N-acetyl-gamma-glutamyl-phosphate reductase [Tepidibacillus marianensis]|uniref:N-acetyl-gamma-glutamyl-phosphate reductase n=1 Tax=Tepidibacillus marianensis TaxID=3131995 RepID=UPI0030CB4A55
MELNVIIVGASGYSGLELIRILLQHPKVTITHLFAGHQEYDTVIQLFPHLRSFLDLPIETLEQLTDQKIKELKQEAEFVFLATPSGVSSHWGPKFFNHGFQVIDLSGDFRLKDVKVYEEWYQKKGPDVEIVKHAVYGLAEVFPDEIKDANYIANPGCYTTSILLALAPLYKRKVPIQSVIIDAKSGVSGAGRGLSIAAHYSEVNENLKAYKVGKHQHIPEVEQILSQLSERNIVVQMITHLIPMTRGILSTIYLDIEEEIELSQVFQFYREDYEQQPFIRLLPQGSYPETKQVCGTNFCDISIFYDERTKKLVLFSAIDNLVKGAAGQAVQNLNLMMRWDQTLGLKQIPIYP